MATGRIGPRSSRFNDLTGRRFGNLVVELYLGLNQSKRRRSLWQCKCDCGAQKIATVQALIAGQCNQCDACLKLRIGDASRTHGWSDKPEYQCWAAAIQRCTNPKATGFDFWGGRGITICDRWRLSFADFLADMGPRPPGCNSLDRYPNPDGNYEPGNCRWATPLQQSQNMRNNVVFEFAGQRLCLSEWSRLLGIKRPTLDARLRRGLSFEAAISTPARYSHA